MPRSCVIFDFDGVIADTEALHLEAYNHAFQACRQRIGGELVISHQQYFGHYIVFGNREGFWHMLRDAGRPHDEGTVAELSRLKDELFEGRLHGFAEPLPGVRTLLAFLEERGVPRAICSGARRAEIDPLLVAFGVAGHFDVVVTIEDVRQGKPDPEGYNLAFDRLHVMYDAQLEKSRSLVIEDSAGGCAAARAAGIPVLGVGTSLPLERLRQCADYAVENLSQLDLAMVGQWLKL